MDVLEEQEAPLQDTQLEDIDFGVSVSGSGPQTAECRDRGRVCYQLEVY